MPAILEVADQALAGSLDDLGTATPLVDWCSMRHETQYTRLFRSQRLAAWTAARGRRGPVGSGKTALVDALCKRLRDRYDLAVITNDIYTREDAEFLIRSGALAPERIAGVETGGCPHTAIREDASINLAAIERMRQTFPRLDLVFIESGGDNLAATFSPELADLTIYVIDVAAGDKIPRKGGPGITRSDLLVINKIDLAAAVGRRSRRHGARRPTHARRASVRLHQHSRRRRVREVADFIQEAGGLGALTG